MLFDIKLFVSELQQMKSSYVLNEKDKVERYS